MSAMPRKQGEGRIPARFCCDLEHEPTAQHLAQRLAAKNRTYSLFVPCSFSVCLVPSWREIETAAQRRYRFRRGRRARLSRGSGSTTPAFSRTPIRAPISSSTPAASMAARIDARSGAETSRRPVSRSRIADNPTPACSASSCCRQSRSPRAARHCPGVIVMPASCSPIRLPSTTKFVDDCLSAT